jgi:hypothetical protein
MPNGRFGFASEAREEATEELCKELEYGFIAPSECDADQIRQPAVVSVGRVVRNDKR